MAIEKFFIKEGIKEVQIQKYLSKKFERADYSKTEIQRTPLGTRIVVHVGKPGLVIGKSGKIIKDLTEDIKERFQLENPMLDVREVKNPFFDAQIVATRIAKSIERGSFYKKVVNYYLNEIMKNGAIGVEIKVAGKLGGERGRFQKFKEGYIKHSGYYADNLLERGIAIAKVKLGSIGVQVKILTEYPDDLSIKREVRQITEVEEELEEAVEEEVEKPKKEAEKKKVVKKKVVKEEKKESEKKKPEKKPAKKTEEKKAKKRVKKKVEKKPAKKTVVKKKTETKAKKKTMKAKTSKTTAKKATKKTTKKKSDKVEDKGSKKTKA